MTLPPWISNCLHCLFNSHLVGVNSTQNTTHQNLMKQHQFLVSLSLVHYARHFSRTTNSPLPVHTSRNHHIPNPTNSNEPWHMPHEWREEGRRRRATIWLVWQSKRPALSELSMLCVRLQDISTDIKQTAITFQRKKKHLACSDDGTADSRTKKLQRIWKLRSTQMLYVNLAAVACAVMNTTCKMERCEVVIPFELVLCVALWCSTSKHTVADERQ